MLSLYLILIYSNTFNEILLFVFKYHLTNVKFTNILDLKVSKIRKGDILIISFLILVFFLNKMLVHSKIITFIKPKASWTFLVRCLCVCLSSDFNKSSHVILPKSFLFRFRKVWKNLTRLECIIINAIFYPTPFVIFSWILKSFLQFYQRPRNKYH